ncbi:MAG: xanthine dehydrogenase family protein molybdopterin-binding subunit [Proteobacteria bacterium]|nr:xanthine dehydrogenase family protein molybdopterin-binding subunit [Pseudomonadota bacterium]MDA1323995.1 xanthine dehydrogenase family protein molybdopterin-binding subunit [Pseudomonadota bacterium]
MGQFAIGQSVPRTEDPRLLRGEGQYVDDIHLPNEAHTCFLRSPHAHARITHFNCDAARAMPGVVIVLTGDDWAATGYGQHPASHPRIQRDGSPLFYPPRPALVTGKVMVVGDPIAMVVAETFYQARDAVEAIEIEYKSLPVNVIASDYNKPGAPVLRQDCPSNESFFYTAGDKEAVEAAIASAAHVTHYHTVINRITANTMEPRVCIGDYDSAEDRYTLYGGTQRPFQLRQQMAQHIFGIRETQLRVIGSDVGGSFGMKSGQFPEYRLVLWASKLIGRPVRWLSDRSEGHATDYHDRDQTTDATLALDENGTFLALKVSNVCGIGAYMESSSTISPAGHLGGLAGTYKTPLIYAESAAVFTNTSSNGPFRGSGRPEAAYVLERIIDNAAREMGIDRAEIRRRNIVPPDAMPFKTGLLFTLDCGEFGENMEQTLAMSDYKAFEDRRAEAAARGKLRGLGIANFIEQTAQLDGETVAIQFDTSGTVTVLAGSISHGQGHDAMYKIVVCDSLGIDSDDIRVASGDTDLLPFGGGTYASRTAILGSSAAKRAADKIIEKGKKLAAHMLEAAEDDIEFDHGHFRVAGTDREVALKEVAKTSYKPNSLPPDMEIGLFATDTFVPGTPVFPNGCHVVEVEIDPETGKTEILRYSVVDDVGTVINKLTLEGQIHGGIGQAVGQALTEQIVYDKESGQLITGSFLDYGMPRADDSCSYDLGNNPVPTKLNPIGAKGAGEAGNVGGLGAIMNAIVDALSPLGITNIDMPATPTKVWHAIRDAKKNAAA